MKILLIAPQPFMEKRGTPLAVFQLLKALGELGYNIDLVTYHLGEDIEIEKVEHHRIPRVPFINRVKKGQSAAKAFLDIFIFLKAVKLLSKKEYDCIHAVEEAAMMGVLLKSIFHTPLIYDMDSSIPEQLKESDSSIWASRIMVNTASFLEKWVINHADVVLAVCQALRDRVKGISPDKRVVVLEDIPNVEPFSPDLQEKVDRLRHELDLNGKMVVLYTGTFEAYQGIDLLLEAIPDAIKKFPNVKFVLVGGEPGQVQEKLLDASELGIKEHVIILGKRPLDEMPLFMEMADILVSPRNKGTNTPMKIYTYLQSGKPIVATRLITHTQVLTDDVSLLVEPDPTALANGIITLLRDDRLRERLGEAGKRLVEERYSYDSFREKVEGAYNLIREKS
jgi:glycosyltransferase involved in cell wall biosynthesis